jgi:hypothetical protein
MIMLLEFSVVVKELNRMIEPPGSEWVGIGGTVQLLDIWVKKVLLVARVYIIQPDDTVPPGSFVRPGLSNV